MEDGDADEDGAEAGEWVEDPRFGAPYIFFAVHLLRSHVFALEAAAELAALAEAAGPGLFDPQTGLFADRFDPDAFLAGWREANAAEQADAVARAEALLTLPAAANEQTWRWNAGREALRQSLSGTVTLRVLVDVDGRPIDVQVAQSSGHRILDAVARKQVLAKWRFKAAMQDGRAVQAIGLVPVVFDLDG